MSLVTIKVEIDHGQITPLEPERLPAKGSGLLTILTATPAPHRRASVSEFISEWSGKFSVPSNDSADPRLQHLTEKHVK